VSLPRRKRSLWSDGATALTPQPSATDSRDAEIARQRGVITAQAEHILQLNVQLDGLRSVVKMYRTRLANFKAHINYLGRPLRPRPLGRAARKSKDLN
jgi:hypothetical protein